MVFLFADGPGPSSSSKYFSRKGQEGQILNYTNQEQRTTGLDTVQPAGSSTEPCRFKFPDPVLEKVCIAFTIPIYALFVIIYRM